MPDRILKPVYQYTDQSLYLGFAIIVILTLIISVGTYSPLPLAIPAAILFFLLACVHVKSLVYIFFGLLPFSIEFQFGSLGIDLPTEPILVALTGLFFLIIIHRNKDISKQIFTHPVSLIIIAQVGWIFITGFFSEYPVISFKFLAAKIWYVVPLYFLPLILFKKKNYRSLLLLLISFLSLAIVYVMVKHASLGFTFKSINSAVRPIFRNHVNYAVMLVAVLPFVWYLIKTAKRKHLQWLALSCFMPMLLLAIYLTYTRAAHLSVIIIIGLYLVIRWRLLKQTLLIGAITITGLIIYMTHNNTYLEHAPNYERTVSHSKFDNLIEATYKMEDISTMERLYRWVAGFHMVADKPVFGHGPSTFYSTYRSYTISSFKTYVSDNPEKSGIHNNYLMVFVEQGVVGFIIMLLLATVPLLYAENIYHRLKNTNDRALIMAAAMCFGIIGIIILINDLIEADKVGALYFFSLAIITSLSLTQIKPGPSD